MIYRPATPADAPLLASMNKHLIEDEAHRNPMSLDQLEARMITWLATDYHAILFLDHHTPLGYTLYRPEPDFLYIRHFFIHRHLRRTGLGRAAFTWLRQNPWRTTPKLRIDVLLHNPTAIAFWRAVGFHDYALIMET